MNIDRVNSWLTLVGNVGILVGIGFLVVEISQNTQATTAASRDSAVEHVLSFFELSMDNQVIARAQHKYLLGEDLDDFERRQLGQYQYYNFKIFANIHIQYEQGLFSDEEWAVYRTIIENILKNDQIALQMWQDTPSHWTEEFRQNVLFD